MRYLLLGLSLGFGAGLAPGPLLMLVISTALTRGVRAAVRLAFVPLVSDTVVVLVSVFVVHELPARAIGALGVVGGLFVVWLGIEALREQPADVEASPRSADPFLRGVAVNLVSPHPWLFWITVGSPLLLAAWSESRAAAVAFLVTFYAVLVGVKVVIATLVGRGRRRLSPSALHRAHRISGALLLSTGIVLIVEFAGALLR